MEADRIIVKNSSAPPPIKNDQILADSGFNYGPALTGLVVCTLDLNANSCIVLTKISRSDPARMHAVRDSNLRVDE